MKRIGVLILALGALLVLTGQTWPLNPLVTRTPNPVGPVPPECEQGLAPTPMPRVNVAELPAPAEIAPAVVPAAPPSRTLRRTLEDAHAALTRNDRAAFDAALASARIIVRDYPPGAERTAAEDAVRAYEDAAFLWDAQFASPFFDESSEAYARASRYPGYTEAVRRGVFTDDRDRRFYPAAESRQFVGRVASQRLGIRTPAAPTTRVARAERPSRSTSSSVSAPAPRRTARSTTPRRAANTSTTRTRKSATPAISAPASPDPPAPARAVAESAPAAPPAAAPTPAAAPASPAAEGLSVDDVPEPVTEPTTAPAEPPAPSTTSAAPTTPEPTTTTTTAAPAPERRSMVIPALLILLGLGVLIVLFRVSK